MGIDTGTSTQKKEKRACPVGRNSHRRGTREDIREQELLLKGDQEAQAMQGEEGRGKKPHALRKRVPTPCRAKARRHIPQERRAPATCYREGSHVP